MKRHIPNIITSCNLISGAIAIVYINQQEFSIALLLILLAAVFDFCDGLTARALGVSSPIGKELDSLADCVSFGVAPAMMLLMYLLPQLHIAAFLSLVMAAFAAVRLAKFNLDTRQTTSFIGLATPANTLFWVSLLAALQSFNINNLVLSCVLLLFSFVSSYLLVSELPMFSLKFHNLKWQDNKIQFIFLSLSILSIIALAITTAITQQNGYILLCGGVIITIYMILNIIHNLKTIS